MCASPLSRSKDFFLPLAITEQAPLLVGRIPGVAAHHKQRRLGGPPLERGLIRQERAPALQRSLTSRWPCSLHSDDDESGKRKLPTLLGKDAGVQPALASSQLSAQCLSAPYQDCTALQIG